MSIAPGPVEATGQALPANLTVGSCSQVIWIVWGVSAAMIGTVCTVTGFCLRVSFTCPEVGPVTTSRSRWASLRFSSQYARSVIGPVRRLDRQLGHAAVAVLKLNVALGPVLEAAGRVVVARVPGVVVY